MEKAKRGLWIRYICDYENTVKKNKKNKKNRQSTSGVTVSEVLSHETALVKILILSLYIFTL